MFKILKLIRTKIVSCKIYNRTKLCLKNKDTNITSLSTKVRNYQMIALLAFNLFTRKKETNKQKSEMEIENQLAHVIAMAELALRDRDIDKAEAILSLALNIAEEHKVHVGVSCVYDMLATIAFQQGEINKAEEYLVRIIERLIDLGYPEDNNTIVNFKLKLSRIYTNINNDERAELGFKNCLKVQQNKISKGKVDEETDHLYVSILFWYGKFLMDRGRTEEARTQLDLAYVHSERVKGIKPAQEMVLLYYLADLCFTLKDYDNAAKYILNALIIGKNIDNPDTPHYFVKLGLIYMFKGIYDKAKIWCKRGENFARKYRNKPATLEAQDCLRQLEAITKSPS